MSQRCVCAAGIAGGVASGCRHIAGMGAAGQAEVGAVEQFGGEANSDQLFVGDRVFDHAQC
jgi:hypothetical protein